MPLRPMIPIRPDNLSEQPLLVRSRHSSLEGEKLQTEAILLTQDGRFHEAGVRFLDARNAYGGLTEMLAVNWSYLLNRQGQFKRAYDMLSLWVDQEECSYELLLNMAYSCRKTHQLTQAMNLLSRAVAKNPSTLQARLLAADAGRRCRQFQDAQLMLDCLHTQSAEARLLLFQIFCEQGFFDDAANLYQPPGTQCARGSSAILEELRTHWAGKASQVKADLRRRGFCVMDRFLPEPIFQSIQKECLCCNAWMHKDIEGEAFADIASGFASPALLAIGWAMRECLLQNAGLRFHNCWGYVYPESADDPSPHADDGTFSINLWMTDDKHNCSPKGRGGLILWNRRASKNYFFLDRAQQGAYLRQRVVGKGSRISYAANRAVIFPSRMIHKTDGYRFGPDKESRRMNITWSFASWRYAL